MTIKEMAEYLKKMIREDQKMFDNVKNNPSDKNIEMYENYNNITPHGMEKHNIYAKNIDNISFCLQAKKNIKKHGLDFKTAGYTW